LAGRQILLLLDDAGSVEQVLPLMPGTPGAVVLITSRSPLLALPAATHTALDVLTEPEAIQLLARVAGPDRVVAEPAAAVEIVRRCGLLLLAIRIAGGQIGRLYQAGFLNGCVDVDDESITWLERALVAIRAEARRRAGRVPDRSGSSAGADRPAHRGFAVRRGGVGRRRGRVSTGSRSAPTL
jgi:hypothetical protein